MVSGELLFSSSLHDKISADTVNIFKSGILISFIQNGLWHNQTVKNMFAYKYT